MANTLSQTLAPDAESRIRNRKNVFYPQARATLQVILENYGTPESPLVIPVVPRSVTIYSNSYKEADTWSMEFETHGFPITPEVIKTGQVEIFLYQTQGIGQSPETLRADDPGETFGLAPSIVGLFDEYTVELSSDGGTCTIDGQDFTSLFISKQWDPSKRVKTGRSLDDVVRELAASVSGASNLTVVTVPENLAMPIVGRSGGRTTRNGISFGDDKTYWDVIYDVVARHGFIVFVRNLEIVITTPQNYIAGRTLDRKMLWGRNLSSLRMSRRMGKEQVPVVEVRSYDDKGREPISARYPSNPKIKPVTGLGTNKDEVRIFTIYGIRDIATLKQAAESYYNLVARSEQKIEIQTMDLVDLEGTDLLEMRAGDSMTIGFDAFNSDSIVLEGQNREQRINTLKGLGYDPVVAAEIALAFDRVDLFKRPFRVREVTFEWSHDSGLSISAELQNYVDVRGQTP